MDVTPERAEKLAQTMANILVAKGADKDTAAELVETFGYLMFQEFLELPSRRDSALQAEAVLLVARYGLLLPAPAKDFFRKLADHLNWDTLREKLK